MRTQHCVSIITIVAAVAIGALEADGGQLNWTGAVSNDWDVSGNWTPMGVPSAANPVLIDPPSQVPCINLYPGMASGDLVVGGARAFGYLGLWGGTLVTTGPGVIGELPGSYGEVEVIAGDWDVSEWLNVGNNGGAGVLRVLEGGQVSSEGYCHVGYGGGAAGGVLVSGAGSALTSGIGILVGFGGWGELTAVDAGAVQTETVFIGFLADSIGTLNVESGGVLSCNQLLAGYEPGSDGMLNVLGSGTEVVVDADLFLGFSGSGEVFVGEAGVLEAATTTLGGTPEGTGTLRISGPNSSWTSTESCTVGDGGTGVLTVADAGLAQSPEIILANEAGASGTLNIGAPAGSPAEPAGYLDTPSIYGGAGYALVNFNHNSVVNFEQGLFGSVKVSHLGPGTTILRHANNTYTGGTTVDEGVLRAVGNGSLGANSSTVTLQTGGVLMNQDADLDLSVNRAINLAQGEGRLQAGWEKTLTVNGPITGPGDLVVMNDSGVVYLAGVPKAHTGATNASGALYINTSVVSPTNRALAGGTMGGDGVINGGLSVRDDGAIAPGAGPDAVGSLHVATHSEFRNGSTYHWNLRDASLDSVSGAGNGWDVLTLGNSLSFTSTPGVTVVLTTIDPNSGEPGAADGFDSAQSYSWLIIDGSASGAGNQYPNFNPAAFTIDAGEFVNPFSGTFSVRRDDRLIFLDYTPTPAGTEVIDFDVPDQSLPYAEDGYLATQVEGEPGDTAVANGQLALNSFVLKSDSRATVDITRQDGGAFDVIRLRYERGIDVGLVLLLALSDTGEEFVFPGGSGGEVTLNWTGVHTLTFTAMQFGGAFPASLSIDNLVVAAAVPGDCDGSGSVNLIDFSTFSSCFAGPGVAPAPECGCADLDGDGDVDLSDFSTFSTLFGG